MCKLTEIVCKKCIAMHFQQRISQQQDVLLRVWKWYFGVWRTRKMFQSVIGKTSATSLNLLFKKTDSSLDDFIVPSMHEIKFIKFVGRMYKTIICCTVN